jgi:hypothetical protein
MHCSIVTMSSSADLRERNTGITRQQRGLEVCSGADEAVRYATSRPARYESHRMPVPQLAALRFTPLRRATVDSFLSAAFSSLRLVVNNRKMSSRPSSSDQAIKVP